jgi:3-oxoacyl-[acyl-carrier-protein] synthase II
MNDRPGSVGHRPADGPSRTGMTDGRNPGRRVWITGIGVITPIGLGRDAFWEGVRAGRSPVRRIDRFDPSAFRSQVAAQVDDFVPTDFMPPKTARQLDRFSQFGLVAGQMALADAGLVPGRNGAAEPQAIGIYLGSALGGIAYAEEQHQRYLERGIRSVAPNLALAVFGGAAPANLGIALDVRGPILSTANSCASGSVAIGEALGAIRAGEIDAAVAGGVEIPLSPLAFGAFDIIRALSAGHNDCPESAARPFDRERDGFVMGEGAALLVLEETEAAARRGATPYAELLGYDASSDAYHMVQPRPDGTEAARAASIALRTGGVDPSEIDYVNAHASSTPIGDLAEARAIRLALGSRAVEIPVSGTKALYGHPLGASGAIEAAICALTIARGWAPASVNLHDPDPEIAELLPGLLREGRAGTYRRVLSTSFGFGGLNAALVFGAPQG